MRRAFVTAVLIAAPGVAHAQALRCSVPAQVERPRPDLATADQPRRLLPIGSYTLALTWGPGFCRGAGNGARRGAGFQCGGANRFGFTLHGLWPDGVGREWPQYCRATPLISAATVRANLCATPSVQLLQHEWAKHGTCMPGFDPDRYFARARGLYDRLRFPDMDALSRSNPNAGAVAAAVAGANPGLPVESIRVTTTRQGWLDELWLCLDTRFRYERCRAGSGGVSPTTSVRIWRERR